MPIIRRDDLCGHPHTWVDTDLLPRPAAMFYRQLFMVDGHKTHPYGFTVWHRPTGGRMQASYSRSRLVQRLRQCHALLYQNLIGAQTERGQQPGETAARGIRTVAAALFGPAAR